MSDVRLGVVGLGMMGRHHARIAQTLDGVSFVGAADALGDRFGVMQNGTLVSSYRELIELGLDAVVVAVPTEAHSEVGMAMADAGVHALIEKPIAATTGEARTLVDRFEAEGLVLATGHVERFNPALIELRKKLEEGHLGNVFSISTTRIGPFPERIKDVGVTKDLATHDIDIVRWLSGSEFASYAGYVSHQMGRDHEDVVSIVGKTESGVTINIEVNWVTPVKRRSVLVVGQKGALEVDMLTSDLTYYSNSSIPTEWEAVASLRGVSEGDVLRYAIRKPEPLVSELAAFRDMVISRDDVGLATAADGLAALLVAETVLESTK
ncbi:MAG: Gfo/Idh/MocA family protein [Acidimicrobiales bacterium]